MDDQIIRMLITTASVSSAVSPVAIIAPELLNRGEGTVGGLSTPHPRKFKINFSTQIANTLEDLLAK